MKLTETTIKFREIFLKKLLKTTKKQCFNNLNTSKKTDNRTFWKSVVPLAINKPSRGANIILKEDNKNIKNDSELCEVFKTYFSNIVANLNIASVNNYITAKENANKYRQQIKCFDTRTSITKQCLSSSFNFQKTNAN